MKRIIFLVIIFVLFLGAQVNAQIDSKPIAQFEFSVPENYNHDTQISSLAKKAKIMRVYDFSKEFTDANFANVTAKLVPGDYEAKIFSVNNGATYESCYKFTKGYDNVVIAGAQGLALAFEFLGEKFPEDKIIASVDKIESLLVDSSGNHGYPIIRTNSKDKDFAFGIDYAENDMIGDNRCLIIICTK